MNKKAILGLMLAILLPMTGYYMVKYYSDRAVHLPRRYFYDSVAVIEKNGKTMTDTIWHRVKNMEFTNQLGKTVTLDSLKGKILVIDFFLLQVSYYLPRHGKKHEALTKLICKQQRQHCSVYLHQH